MTTPTYDNVRPLVQTVDVRGRNIQVRFTCPISGTAVDARYSLPRDHSMGSRVSQQMKRNLMWSLQSAVASAIRSTMGHNMAGRVASDVARSAMTGVQQQVNSNTLSAREQSEALVEAFRTKFRYDCPNGEVVGDNGYSFQIIQEIDKG